MILRIEKAPIFRSVVTNQFSWYDDRGGEKLAWRLFAAVDLTILKLSRQPDLGWVRRFRHASLGNLRSYRVEPPFEKVLIFYRVTENVLTAWRLMHGSRNLGQRLAEPFRLND